MRIPEYGFIIYRHNKLCNNSFVGYRPIWSNIELSSPIQGIVLQVKRGFSIMSQRLR